MFVPCNRGKRNISLNLKNESGRAIAYDLAANADVVVESFGRGVIECFGFGYEDLVAEIDKLVYCSITGFGQDGPYKQYPAYDPVAQAMSGSMSVTSPTDGDPVRVGTSAIDYTTGLIGAMLVMGGLICLKSDGGTYIDLSLFDVATTWMGYWVAHYTSTAISLNDPERVSTEWLLTVFLRLETDSRFTSRRPREAVSATLSNP